MPPTEIEIAIFSEPMQKNVLRHYGKEYTFQLIMTKGTPEAQSLLIAEQADLATVQHHIYHRDQQRRARWHFRDRRAVCRWLSAFAPMPILFLADSGIKLALKIVKGKTVGVNAICLGSRYYSP